MKNDFGKNNKYNLIAAYAIFVIAVGVIIHALINHIPAVKAGVDAVFMVLSPFLVGLFIAYLVNPLVKKIGEGFFGDICKIKNKSVRHRLGILFSYLIVVGVITALMFYIIPQFVMSLRDISDFAATAQSGYAKIIAFIENNVSSEIISKAEIEAYINALPNKIAEFAKGISSELLTYTLKTGMNVVSGLVNFLISFVVSIYLLIDKDRLLKACRRIIRCIWSKNNADKILSTLSDVNKLYNNFIVGKLADSLIIGCLTYIVLIIFNIPYSLLIAVIVGVTNMIPYFGPFIGGIPSVLFMLLIDLKSALILAVVIICIQQLDGLIIGPKILGDKVGVRPLWVMFGITVGGSVAGVLGMFLGVPTVAAIGLISSRLIDKRLDKKGVLDDDLESGLVREILGEQKEEAEAETEGKNEQNQGEKAENKEE
mgnify:CR=1 FL=1